MFYEDPRIVEQYPDETVRTAFYTGHVEGFIILKHANWDEVTAEAWEQSKESNGSWIAVCHAKSVEEHARDFSPFEWTAKAFNESENPDAMWNAYEAGVSHGAEAGYWYFIMIGEGAA